MKIRANQFKSLAAKIPTMSGFLIYGTDAGAIDESAADILRWVLKGDAMGLIPMSMDSLKETPTKLWDEMRAMSMFGGRRLIHFKNPSDALAKELALLIQEKNDPFLLMTSDSLNTKSALVKWGDDQDQIGCMGCYPQEAGDVRQTAAALLTEAGCTITPDAMALLVSSLGSDKGATISEIQKLITYLGAQKQASVDDVAAVIGNGSAVSADDLVMAALSGQHVAVQKALGLLIQEGSQPVTLIRVLIYKLNQLLLVMAKIKAGDPVDIAIKKTPPFIPFKYDAVWRRVVSAWTDKAAKDSLAMMSEAEKNCKTGLPADLICQRAFTSLTALARRMVR